MKTADNNLRVLRTMTKGAYDLQMLRMQTGLRLCANFRHKLKQEPSTGDDEEINQETQDISEEAKKTLNLLKLAYKRLTDAIVAETDPKTPRIHRLLNEKTFPKGDALISEFTEYVLVTQYLDLERQEHKQFRQLEDILQRFPIYNTFLKHQIGIGPAMSAVLITYFDIHIARHPSQFWNYCGLDVGPDGRGRSRREEHLITREYIAKDGTTKTRLSTTYQPWLKARLIGALATSFLRSNSPWRRQYDNYKHRIQTDPNRRKETSAKFSKIYKDDQETALTFWTPGRIHQASVRYMLKMFLKDFWIIWRNLEGYDTENGYYVDVLGMEVHDNFKDDLELAKTRVEIHIRKAEERKATKHDAAQRRGD